jgi:hypothetical protein
VKPTAVSLFHRCASVGALHCISNCCASHLLAKNLRLSQGGTKKHLAIAPSWRIAPFMFTQLILFIVLV